MKPKAKSKGLAKSLPLPADAPLIGRRYMLEGHGYAGNIVQIKRVWYAKKIKEWMVKSNNERYESDHTETLKEFNENDPILIEKEYEADLEGWAAKEMERIEKGDEEDQEKTEANASMALARPNTKQTLIEMRSRIEMMRQRAELVQRIMAGRLERLRSRASTLKRSNPT